jgi:hypothetical protein
MSVYSSDGTELLADVAVSDVRSGRVRTVELDDGSMLAVWFDQSNFAGFDIYAQRVDTKGNLLGDQYTLNSTQANNQMQADIVALNGGGFAAVWQSYGQEGELFDVYARLFNTDGSALSAEIQINQIPSGQAVSPVIAQSSDGTLVVAWEQGSEIWTQQLRSDGVLVGDNQVISQNADGQLVHGTDVDLATLSNGGVIASWDQGGNIYARAAYAPGVSTASTDLTNTAPVLTTETDLSIVANQSTEVQAFTVSDAELDELTVSISEPGHGSVLLNSDNTYSYTPDSGYVGSDYFVLTVSDGSVQTRETISISVTAESTPVDLTELQLLSGKADGGSDWTSVAALPNGGFVAVWHDGGGKDGDRSAVYGRLFDANYQRIGDEFLVNTLMTGFQTKARVASTPDGHFMVVWCDDNGSLSAQIYDATGEKQGIQFTVGPWYVAEADIIGTSDNKFIVVRTQNNEDAGILSVYNSDGIELFNNVALSDVLASEARVVELADGRLLASWWDGRNTDGSDIFGRFFNSDGTLLGDAFKLNQTLINNQQAPEIVALEAGGFAVVWQSEESAGGTFDIYARLFDADGNAVSDDILVSDDSTEQQIKPAIDVASDGTLVIAWESNHLGSSQIIYQTLSSAGEKLGTNQVASQTTESTNVGGTEVALATLEDGSVLATWDIGGNVYGRILHESETPPDSILEIDLASSRLVTGMGNFEDIDVFANGKYFITRWASDGSANAQGFQIADPGFQQITPTEVMNNYTELWQQFGTSVLISNDQMLSTWDGSRDESGLLPITPAQITNSSGEILVDDFAMSESLGGQKEPLYINGKLYIASSTGGDVLLSVYDSEEDFALQTTQVINAESEYLQSEPDIALLKDSLIVFAWQSNNDPNYATTTGAYSVKGNSDIRFVLYDLVTGSKSADFVIAQLGDAGLKEPQVAAVGDGRFIVSWSETTYDNSATATHFAQTFSADGTALSDAIEIANYTLGSISSNYPGGYTDIRYAVDTALTAGPDGTAIFAWNQHDLTNSVFDGGVATLELQDSALRVSDKQLITEIDGDSSARIAEPVIYTHPIDGYGVIFNNTPDTAFVVPVLSAVDAIAPSVPIINTVAGDDVIAAGELDNLSISGTAESLATMTLTSNYPGVDTYTTQASVDGVWEFRYSDLEEPIQLDDGTYTVSVTATDQSGNISKAASREVEIALQPQLPPISVDDTTLIINTETNLTQYDSRLTALTDGTFISSWKSNLQDGSSYGIYAQRLEADGTKLGLEFQVNSTTANEQSTPNIIALSDGGFVTVWVSWLQDGSKFGVYAQRFNAENEKIGDEFLVNSTTVGSQENVSVGQLQDGGFIVVWQDDRKDGSNYGIYAQRFDANVSKVGDEFLVNTTTAGAQLAPRVTGTEDGGFFVSWRSNTSASVDSDTAVMGQFFNSDEVPLGAEKQFFYDPDNGNEIWSSVTTLSDGNIAITWTVTSSQESKIYSQIIGKDGVEITNPILINDTASSDYSHSVIKAVENGFVVAWQSNIDQPFSGYDIIVALYDNDGNAVGDHAAVSSQPATNDWTNDVNIVEGGYNPSFVDMAINDDGKMIISWTGDGESSSEIFASTATIDLTQLASQLWDAYRSRANLVDDELTVELLSDFSPTADDPFGSVTSIPGTAILDLRNKSLSISDTPIVTPAVVPPMYVWLSEEIVDLADQKDVLIGVTYNGFVSEQQLVLTVDGVVVEFTPEQVFYQPSPIAQPGTNVENLNVDITISSEFIDELFVNSANVIELGHENSALVRLTKLDNNDYLVTKAYTGDYSQTLSKQTFTDAQYNALTYVGDEWTDSVVIGADDADTIKLSNQNTALYTGAGNDTIVLDGNGTFGSGLAAYNISSSLQTGTEERINLNGKTRFEDVMDGGADVDTVELTDASDAFFLHDSFSGFHSSLTLANDYDGRSGTARIENIENINAGDGDDIVDLTSPDYSLDGQNIAIDGGNGNDTLWGSDANEILNGGTGDDVLFGGAGTNTLTGGSGADEFQFTRTSIADTVTDYDLTSGDQLAFFYGAGSEEADWNFSILDGDLLWGENTIDFGTMEVTSLGELSIFVKEIGSDSEGDVVSNLMSVGGKAIKGPLVGAEVFADYNENGVWDAKEPKTTTNADGTYDLDVTQSSTIIVNTLATTIDTSTGNLIGAGTVLKAPAGATVVSPTTTLLASGVDEASLKAALGIPASVDLNSFDPFAAGADSTAALAYEKASITVFATVKAIQAAAVAAGGDSDAALSAAVSAVVELVQHTSTVSGTSVFEDMPLLSNALRSVSIQLAASDVNFNEAAFDAVSSDVATAIATVYTAIQTLTDIQSDATSAVVSVATEILASQITSAVDGSGSITLTDSTVLDVAAAAVNLAPTDITFSNDGIEFVEGIASGSVIGSFDVMDPNSGDSADFELVAGLDAANFSLSQDGELKFLGTADFETKSAYSVAVKVTDGGGKARTETFDFSLIDVSGDADLSLTPLELV